MDRGALIEILGEIANNDAQTVKKELNDFVVSLRAQMQEVGPKDMEKKATELGLPQQAAEKTHLPGGGRADSGPVHGVGSLVQQPIEEEQQQRAQGNEFVSVVEDTPALEEVGKAEESFLLLWPDPLTGRPHTTPTPDTLRHSPASINEPRLPAESTKQNGLYGTNEPLLIEKSMVPHISCRAQQETQASGKIQGPDNLPTEPQLANATSQSPSDGKFFSTWVASSPIYIPGSLPAKQHSPGLAEDCTPPSTSASTPPHSVTVHEPTAGRRELKDMKLQSFGQKNVSCSAHRNLEKAVCWIHGKQYGNGTFVFGKGGGATIHYWVITCCHIFFRKDITRDERKRMNRETFRTMLITSFRQTTFEGEGSKPVPAEDVLLYFRNPVFCFDQEYDLLAIKVKSPTNFSLGITPYPLNPEWNREVYLLDAQLFNMIHFQPAKSSVPGQLQFTTGKRECLKDTDRGVEMNVIRHTCDTHKGSSGAPLMYATDGGFLLLLAVHMGGGQTSKLASVLNKSFLSEMMKRMK